MTSSEHDSLLNDSHESSSRQLHEEVPYYASPHQRQYWDDNQVLPHVNWGDLFWDLYYVSGAYNLASAFKESLSMVGLLYFVVCYLSIFYVWGDKVVYDSKYAPPDNLFHRVFEVVHILVLGTIIQHIRKVSVMSDPENPNMVVFCMSLAVESALVIARAVDIRLNVVGGDEARRNAESDVRRKLGALVMQVLATVLAIRGYRHAPIICCGLAYVVSNIVAMIERFVVIRLTNMSHKQTNVPVNIEFMLHRLGEWTMLMLGESVLALLIVEQSAGRRYYVTFYCGILTVTLFQYLFFRSQPFEADDHAFRRSSAGGFFFYYSMTIYSACLILVGCSYKMILHQFLEEDESEEEGAEMQHDNSHLIADLFSYSMALSFFALDMMIIAHRGWAANFSRFLVGGRTGLISILIVIADYMLLFITFSLSSVITDLELLSVAGLSITFLQVILRTRGLKYFPVSKKAMEDHQVPRWPNTTQPGVSYHTTS